MTEATPLASEQITQLRTALEGMAKRHAASKQNWEQAVIDAQNKGDRELSVSLRNTALQALDHFPIAEALAALSASPAPSGQDASQAQIPLAEVRVADTDDGWRAVACFSFTTGNWWGQSSPITDRCPSFGYREAAIASAASDLFEHLSNAPRHAVEQSMEGQRRKVLNWLAGLSVARPQQMDLFA